MNEKENYYGSEQNSVISYLEFGSVDIEKGKKEIWGYWQDQTAYDFYMFSRYARDIFAFRHFFDEEEKNVETLNQYVLKSAHNKLLDYIFKYAGILTVNSGGGICESGSSLYGLIDETIACDMVFNEGNNIERIKSAHYIASDISDMMNEGAKAFHPDIKIESFPEPTIKELVVSLREKSKVLDLFYGLSVSIRYAVRQSQDLIDTAKISRLSIYNRLSMSFGGTITDSYGTGKTVYIISLPELISYLDKNKMYAKFCTANMQYERDGEDTIRASVIISRDEDVIKQFISEYEKCAEKCEGVSKIEKGEWKNLCELMDMKSCM